MKLLSFTTAINAMPPENRFPALAILILAIAGYFAIGDLNSRCARLEQELSNCNTERFARLVADVAQRDSIVSIIRQNSAMLKRIERKL
jgi:hypothetical protein